MKSYLCAVLFFFALPLGAVRLSADDRDQPVNFARKVLPILSDKCFVCHGPDTHDESELRLDSFAEATMDRGGYRAIDPDDPANSELLVRIHSTDAPMPPAEAEKQLTDGERQLLSEWVMQGGQYASHWAYVAPTKSSEFSDPSAAIDALIAAQLKSNNVDFAPSADKHVLARRAALVLTGLPLEPEQLAAHLNDDRDDAYEHLVDQLLDNPRFGEHQARYWLDAVRYGDTHGLHLDNRRGIYPYRDWVVRAFNRNLAFDKFIEWQLAGDLLPNPTLEQQVATGYVRLNPSTGEGGAIPAEFQMKNNFDRVETLGTVFLGMSLTCARCHSHKYDPIEQREYYNLLAFFNSTAEPALDGNSYTYGPTVRVPMNQAAWRHWEELQQRGRQLVDELEATIDNFAPVVQFAVDRQGWQASNWRISKPQSKSDPDPPLAEQEGWVDAKGLPGTLDQQLTRQRKPSEDQVVWISFALQVAVPQTLDIAFSGAAGSHLLVDEQNVPLIDHRGTGLVTASPLRVAGGDHLLRIAVFGSSDLANIDVQITNRWAALAQSKSWAALGLIEQLDLMADARGPLAGTWSDEAQQILDQLRQAESEFTTTLVAKELPQPRETKMLRRGEYDLAIGDPLSPDVIAVLNPLPAGAAPNRLGLAKWLTAAENPLVARVLVNRFWQQVFGHALVRTPEEFGLQGEQPTHPELLDWLAVDFRASGWDMKRLFRAMVTSRTFRQDSAWREDIDDPENRLYARGSSYRLDAEVLRDIGLWCSQLLDPAMGGEGVKPYQPEGMWLALAHPASNTKQYQRDSGKKLYRRSLYVYWKRTSPHPMMTLFDAPDRESSCVRRSRTNTPLQSLGMLNETQRVEMGRQFAQRLIRAEDHERARIDMMFRLLAHREATDVEFSACRDLLSQARQRYRQTPADARSLLAVGDAQRDDSIDAVEHAAWTQLATMILASDVAILLY